MRCLALSCLCYFEVLIRTYSRTRAWLSDAIVVRAEPLDSSTPSPGTLSANTTPPPADEAQPHATTCTPTALENKNREDRRSNASTVLAKGWRIPLSTPMLLEQDEQVASADDVDDDDDLSSWSSEVAFCCSVLLISSCLNVTLADRTACCKTNVYFSQGTPAHDEIDADFMYGPQLPRMDFALNDDEISTQVI